MSRGRPEGKKQRHARGNKRQNELVAMKQRIHEYSSCPAVSKMSRTAVVFLYVICVRYASSMVGS